MNATLDLTGSGFGQPTVLSFDQLAKMPSVRLDNVLMRKSHEADELTSWQGPALELILAVARIKPGPMTVSLEAEDGYRVETRLEDLKDAIIAVKDGDGQWLADTEVGCALKLVPPHLPGNFWVVNISRIRVEPAGESTP